ncbi:HK97 family phage prohead protease [Rhizobium ruizarguesonis]|uniref:HK97 family phage prohead protease n=1 Tax=Rhizobium ruizarguesonis TaxID=2081791 RepID=UPI0018D4F73F|nr:HK97 family phage prohead protease [Rhizobium ruizarguesonis]
MPPTSTTTAAGGIPICCFDASFKAVGDEDSGEFEGYGSVFGIVDSYNEVVDKGAFADSLAKNGLPKLLQLGIRRVRYRCDGGPAGRGASLRSIQGQVMPIQVDEERNQKAAPLAVLIALGLIGLAVALGWRWILFVFIVLAVIAGWYLGCENGSFPQYGPS